MVDLMLKQILLATASLAVIHCICAAAESKAATDELSSAIIGLRGGFDSNPANGRDTSGSPTLTTFATWDYLHGTVQDGYSAKLVLVETQYDPRVLAVGRAHSLTLQHAFTLSDATIKSTLAASDEQSWSQRRSSLSWRQRVDYGLGDFRLFASGEARISALNERNVFNLGDFLPQNENFGTLSLTPGFAWRKGETEIGVSATGSRTHFVDGVDYLGLRRDHNRLQANLFASTRIGELALEGSVSPFRALFPEKEFETVESLLYTARARLPYGAFSLDLVSGRTVDDTTLPFSVLNLVTAHEARVSAKIDAKNAVGLTARRKTDDYIGLDAKSDQKSLGIDYQRMLGAGFTATASAAVRKVKETGARPISSFSLTFGLQKQIDLIGKTEKSGG